MILTLRAKRFAKRYKDVGFRHRDRLLPCFASPRAERAALISATSTTEEMSGIYRWRAEHMAENLEMPELGDHYDQICDVLDRHPRERVRIWLVTRSFREEYLVFELPKLGLIAGAARTPRSV